MGFGFYGRIIESKTSYTYNKTTEINSSSAIKHHKSNQIANLHHSHNLLTHEYRIQNIRLIVDGHKNII